MSLQPFQNPSKEDYFRSLERDYGKPFYQVKPSFDDGLSSYWPYAQNQFRPSHDSNPTVRLHESFIKPISADPYSGNHTWIYCTCLIFPFFVLINIKCISYNLSFEQFYRVPDCIFRTRAEIHDQCQLSISYSYKLETSSYHHCTFWLQH